MVKKPLKDLRIPIMMSTEEVRAIDHWRFENRIATRAEAVRRLCQTGLGFDAQEGEVFNSAEATMEAVMELGAMLLKWLEDPGLDPSQLTTSADNALRQSKSNFDLIFDYCVTSASLKVDIGGKTALNFNKIYDAIRQFRNNIDK